MCVVCVCVWVLAVICKYEGLDIQVLPLYPSADVLKDTLQHTRTQPNSRYSEENKTRK